MTHGRIIAFFIALTLLAQPSMLLAQSTPPVTPGGGTPPPATQQQQNAAASTQTRQRFDPNANPQSSGNTFGGMQFGGVGGAIAACSNAQGAMSGSVVPLTILVNASGGGGSSDVASQSVPVTDTKLNAQLQKASQRENCLDGIAYAVAKNLLLQITNRTLNWVNTGFRGNPFYVRDVDSYLLSVGEEQARLFLERIPNENPVFGNAIRSIVTQNISGIRDGYLDRAMDTPEGRAYQNFQKNFVDGGGWQAFLNPNNNPLVAIFDAADELSGNINTQQRNIRDQLQRNNGFLDMRKCAEYDNRVREVSSTRPTDEAKCLRWETVTPGSLIFSQVSQVTGSSVRQLEQADEINEILGSFFDQLLNGLFTQGLAAIRGRGGSGINFGGLGSNVVIGSNGQPLASVAGDGSILGYQSTNNGQVVNDFDISRPQQVRAILQAQYNYLNRVRDSRAALREIAPLVGALDYCIPGPNPTWTNGLNENASVYFGSLQELQKDSTVFSRLLQSLPVIGSIFGGGSTHAVAAADVQLYDKASDGQVVILDTVYRIRDHTVQFVFNNVQWRYEELINLFKANYTKDAIKNAFAAVDSDQTFARAFVDEAFTETTNLAAYGQNTPQIEAYYTDAELQTQDAIQKLEALRQEATAIVAVAKARYIAERAAAGTPVNMACINDAYSINSSPITPVARQMSDTPSVFYTTSTEARAYFYNNL